MLDVRDYKTGGVWHTRVADDPRARLQAWVMAPLAARRGLRLRLRYEHLATEIDDDPDDWEPDADDLDAVEQELVDLVEFDPGPESAEWLGRRGRRRRLPLTCRYRSICPDSALPGVAGWPRVDDDDLDADVTPTGMTNRRRGVPGTGTLFARGATRRCPRCGSGPPVPPLLHDRAPTARAAGCTSSASRATGPARSRSTSRVFAIFVVAFVVILVFTVPDVPVGPTLAVLVPVMVIGPILFYPFSKTLWMSVDYGVPASTAQPRAEVAGLQVDPEGEDAVGELPRGVADDGEVLEVELGLGQELLALRTRHRGQRPLLHRLGPAPEPLEHRVDIQFIAHAVTLGQRRTAPSRGIGVRSSRHTCHVDQRRAPPYIRPA